MPKTPKETPAMRQYLVFKQRHPDCVLFFRMGDFYECFNEDARTAHRVLGITLTQRTEGVPMAGVPYHSVDNYLRRMIEAGHRVAVCEQIEDPKDARGVVERAVTRVLTPGTLVEETLLRDGEANRVASIAFLDGGEADAARVALALVEVSTGSFTLVTCAAGQARDELARRDVREVIGAESATGELPARFRRIADPLEIPLTGRPAWQFAPDEALRLLREHYRVRTLAGFGLEDDDETLGAGGAILAYLLETQAMSSNAGDGADGASIEERERRAKVAAYLGERAMGHLEPPRRERAEDHLLIDAAGLRALEVERTLRGNAAEGSLAGLFASRQSSCVTPMGRRLVREWLCRPLRERGAIESRHRCVRTLVGDRRLAGELREALAGVQDVPRISARVQLGRASPRDLAGLGRSLGCVRALSVLLAESPAFARQRAALEEAGEMLEPIADEIVRSCVDDAPAHLREGGLFRDGIDAALDECRALERDAGVWLTEYQSRLVAEHELPSLKVGYNKVFGYYIELPAAQARRAPDVFTRKQTLKNAERYITPELKSFEDKVLGARDRAIAREQALFASLCARVRETAAAVSEYARAVAETDVLRCFADRAASRGWVEPAMEDAPILDVRDGRHPVLEELLGGDFVPNDNALGCGDGEAGASLALITGPNMAGKSTYIRQAALIVLLAHAGSFVPAASARIGLTDRVFTRIGADDALHAGQSTFMVEMVETANLLHHATARSLVILDEIGRGTSTLDGLSLAWAIVERLSGMGVEGGACARPRTLFATHYHELTGLAERSGGRIMNRHVQVREFRDEIVFLHTVASGVAPGSFGVQVAQLAGVPGDVIGRARELLASLSVSHAEVDASSVPTARGREGRQLPLFTEYVDHPAVSALREVKLDSMTPLEAFDALRSLVERAHGG